MKITYAVLAVLLAALPAGAQTGALTRIGVAGGVKGKVEALAPAAKAIGRIISSGKELYLNDKVTTDGAGRLQIMLLDQTVFTIGPNSAMKLDEFVYDPNTDTGKVSATIAKGVFRFITGKVARKDPASMKVQLPVGTVGIRGTIAAGQVLESGKSTVVLQGPGPGNNAGEPPGSISVENAGEIVIVSEPGYGSTIDGAGSTPSDAAPVSQQTLDAIADGLGPAPDADSQTDAPGGETGGVQTADADADSPGDLAGQETASAGGSLADVESIDALGDEVGGSTDIASQAAATNAGGSFADGVSDWDEVRTIPSGVGTFSASGPFTLTQCSGTTCLSPSSLNNWSYDVSVDFGARQISGTAQINAFANNATVVDNHAISMSFGSLTGDAEFCCSGSGATYTFLLLNSGGVAAKQLQGDASYDNSATNPTSATIGTGSTLTATRP